MKVFLPLFLLSGCSHVTLNGADITRGLTLAAIGAVAITILADEDDTDPEDKNFRCPTCPPTTKEEYQ